MTEPTNLGDLLRKAIERGFPDNQPSTGRKHTMWTRRIVKEVVVPTELQLYLLQTYVTGDRLQGGADKVAAIKKVREAMNLGLKEAKDFVDEIEAAIRANFVSRGY